MPCHGGTVFGDAAAYERFMGRWSAMLAPFLLDAVALTEPRSVVDVGCGTGHLAAAVVARWPACRVLGVDPSASFVAAAVERLAGTAASARVGDAMQLPVADGSVDAALASLVLNFVPDPQRAASEMARVTRPGGTVAASVWDYGGGMGMLRTFWDAVARLDPHAPGQGGEATPLSRAGGLAALWLATGLDDVVEGELTVVTAFTSFEDYWEPFLLGTGPAGAHVARLSDAGRAALRADLRSRLGPGPFELTARARWVRGTVPA
jgi:SAM-dependent methyltransferase